MAEAISDSKWRAQGDARTLMEADEILKDKPRMTRAKSAAKVLAKEKKADLVSLQKIIKKKPVKPIRLIKPRSVKSKPVKSNKRK